MTKFQILILTLFGLVTLAIIALIVLFRVQPALFIAPTLTPLPTLPPSETPIPSSTATPFVFPATWTPAATATAPRTATLSTRSSATPLKSPTVAAALKTAVAQSYKTAQTSPGGNSSGGLVGLPGGKCEPVIFDSVIKISGAIQNNTNRTVGRVWLRGTIYDKSGKLINTNTGITASDQIAPGQTSTFVVYVDDPNKQFATCDLKFESVDWK